jgi:hypothetical protein
LENDNNAHLKGDKTHFWPYGINGAHEDNGTRMLYYANALIVQSLGEDNLPPVSGAFASPAYTFIHDYNEYYYILSADDLNGSDFSMLKSDGDNLQLQKSNWVTVLRENSYAWQIRFNPTTQLYEFKNLESDKALLHNNSKIQLTDNESFNIQMLGSRQNVVTNAFNLKSYWLTFDNGTNSPSALTTSSNNVSGSRFDHQNSASNQRWVILSRKEVKALAGEDIETKIDDIELLSLIIYSTDGKIIVESTDKGAWINVNDIQGRMVKRLYMQAGMRLEIAVEKGVYVVNGKMLLVE